jgi:hypothetical protein
VASCDYGQGLSECHPATVVKVPPSPEVGGGVWAGGEVGASGGDDGGGGVGVCVCVCVCAGVHGCVRGCVCVFSGAW